MGERGFSMDCRIHLGLRKPVHFFEKEMSTNYINIGTINHGNKDLTINVPAGTNGSELIKAFMSDAEEVSEDEGMNGEGVSGERVSEFKYIHVAVTDEEERKQIHKMVCNIVHLPRMQQICDELYTLMKKRKVLCTINPEAMLSELRRLGMPSDIKGFSDQNFYHYFRAPKPE